MDFDDLGRVPSAVPDLPGTLELGAFSISLNVVDLERSRTFYEALGFEVTGGNAEHGYLILKNGESTIGIFAGMFEGNILTFNPGLTNRMERLDRFLDVREIQSRLEAAGISIQSPISTDAGGERPRLPDSDRSRRQSDPHRSVLLEATTAIASDCGVFPVDGCSELRGDRTTWDRLPSHRAFPRGSISARLSGGSGSASRKIERHPAQRGECDTHTSWCRHDHRATLSQKGQRRT